MPSGHTLMPTMWDSPCPACAHHETQTTHRIHANSPCPAHMPRNPTSEGLEAKIEQYIDHTHIGTPKTPRELISVSSRHSYLLNFCSATKEALFISNPLSDSNMFTKLGMQWEILIIHNWLIENYVIKCSGFHSFSYTLGTSPLLVLNDCTMKLQITLFCYLK